MGLTSIAASPQHQLPPHLLDEVRVNWYMTQWCNYSCAYCPVLVFHKRTRSNTPQPHAFDYYPVEKWLELFDSVEARKLHVHITGGEPFLDRANLRDLLRGFSERPRVHTCISTNGAWDPAYFSGLDKSRIFLDIGFHPTQTTLDTLLKQVCRIRDGGFEIAVVNFVVSPENTDLFETAYRRLTAEQFYVHVSPMFPTGEHLSRDYRTDKELEILVEYNTPLDLHYKVIWPETKGKLCFYPALNYSLDWQGQVQVSCMETSQNAFEKGFPGLPRRAVRCPRNTCIGCCEQYRAIVDEPLYERDLRVFTHRDLAAEVSDYRQTVREQMTPDQIREEASDWQAKLSLLKKENGENQAVRLKQITPAASAPAAPPDGSIVGYLNATDNQFFVKARSQDRIMLNGWTASAENGTPLREIRIRIEDRVVASVREWYPRPDVAAHFGREDWLMSGWRTMLFLPTLPTGRHEIVVEGVDREGVTGTLAPWPLHIVD